MKDLENESIWSDPSSARVKVQRKLLHDPSLKHQASTLIVAIPYFLWTNTSASVLQRIIRLHDKIVTTYVMGCRFAPCLYKLDVTSKYTANSHLFGCIHTLREVLAKSYRQALSLLHYDSIRLKCSWLLFLFSDGFTNENISHPSSCICCYLQYGDEIRKRKLWFALRRWRYYSWWREQSSLVTTIICTQLPTSPSSSTHFRVQLLKTFHAKLLTRSATTDTLSYISWLYPAQVIPIRCVATRASCKRIAVIFMIPMCPCPEHDTKSQADPFQLPFQIIYVNKISSIPFVSVCRMMSALEFQSRLDLFYRLDLSFSSRLRQLLRW